MLFSIFLIAAAQIPATNAGSVTATGELEPRELPFHRIAYYRVEVEAPAGVRISLAAWPGELPGLEVAFEAPASAPTETGGQRFVQRIRLAPVRAQQFELPAVQVLADGQAAATLYPGKLSVRPLTSEEEAQARESARLITLAELAEERSGILRPGLTALIVLSLSAAAFFYWRFRNGTLGRPPTPPAPLAEALARLDGLENQLGRISCGEAYVAISAAVRIYLERAYGLPVAELSTPEFVAGPLAALECKDAHRNALAALLVESDRVKFAQLERDASQQRGAIVAARDLVLALDRPEGSETNVAGAI